MNESENMVPAGPEPQNYQDANTAEVMGVWDWVLMNVVVLIPLVNLILMIVWSLDKNTNPNRSNFAKGYLIVLAARVLISVLLIGMFIGLIVRIVNNIGYNL